MMPQLSSTQILDPALIDNKAVRLYRMAAHDLRVKKPSKAERIGIAEPDVNRNRWQLDEKWYAQQGFFLPD